MRNIGIIWKQNPSSEANIKIQIQNAKHDLPRTQLARPREGGKCWSFSSESSDLSLSSGNTIFNKQPNIGIWDKELPPGVKRQD